MACALARPEKLHQYICIETTESGESREVVAFRSLFKSTRYKTVFLSNRLEWPLQAVHIAIMNCFP